MDVPQITSTASGLDNLDLGSKVNTILLKKTLDNQQETIASIINSVPALPSNPAIGHNINIVV